MPYITKRKVGTPNKIEQKEAQKRHNDKWSRYYQNRQYKKLRDWYMATHPLCIDCLFNGISRPATQLHHITPISTGVTDEDKMRLLLDWEHNFAALCEECHDKRHGKLKNRS